MSAVFAIADHRRHNASADFLVVQDGTDREDRGVDRHVPGIGEGGALFPGLGEGATDSFLTLLTLLSLLSSIVAPALVGLFPFFSIVSLPKRGEREKKEEDEELHRG